VSIHKNVLLNKETTDVNITHVLGKSDKSRSQYGTYISKALILSEDAKLGALLEKNLNSIANLSVPKVTLN